MSLPRQIAERLLRHAAAIMPDHRRDWAMGMQAELAAIDAPGPALAFAAGCVRAAYQQRISPMRIALLTGRLAVALASLLTAAAHAFVPLYILAVVADLKRNSLDGWAGGFPLFENQTAESAVADLLLIPTWHVVAMLGLAGAFGTAAWFMMRGDFRRLLIAVGAGAAIHTANTMVLIETWPSPYLVHPALAWLDYLAFALLLVAAATFLGLDRWTTRPRLAV
ncbi:hypothetical protein ASD89_17045 [Caulobacter sp. Root656]|nr:hypothetical protein ASD89_17045 [Caulobacter sp. Root656]